jgi:hypothetical protein
MLVERYKPSQPLAETNSRLSRLVLLLSLGCVGSGIDRSQVDTVEVTTKHLEATNVTEIEQGPEDASVSRLRYNEHRSGGSRVVQIRDEGTRDRSRCSVVESGPQGLLLY